MLKHSHFLEEWPAAAANHAAKVGWPPGRIHEAARCVERAFGAAWLEKAMEKPSRYPLTTDPKIHPVGHWARSPVASYSLQLLELALYLTSCSALPGFDDVVPLLRASTQFSTARVQLGLAHRLQRAGVDGIELEPSADNGRKADVGFVFAGRTHLLECYEPAPERSPHHDDLLHDGVKRVLMRARNLGRYAVVRVDLADDLRSFDARKRQRVEQEAKHLIANLPARGRLHKVLRDFDVEVFDVEGQAEDSVRAFALAHGKPNAWIVAPGDIARADVPRMMRGEQVQVTRLGWFVLNARAPGRDHAMQRIADALEAKIAQTRRREGRALGIMAAVTDFAELAAASSRQATDLIRSLQQRVLAAHKDLAGVLLLHHRFRPTSVGAHTVSVPSLSTHWLPGTAGAHVRALIDTIQLSEKEAHILGDWPVVAGE